MNIFQVQAQLIKHESLKDRTIKLIFETGEVSPEKMSDIHFGLNTVGWLVYAPNPFTTEQLHELDNLKCEYEDMGKPPSQRLRNVLFILWKQEPEGYKTAVDHYNAKMETLIEHFKNKLDK